MARWVLLHGTPLTPRAWSGVAAALTDQPVDVPDCTHVAAAGPLPQEALAQQVLGELDAVNQLDVVGHSFGGQVAIELALAAPERVRSLTVLCSRDTPFPAFSAVAEKVRSGDGPTVDAGIARWFTPAEVDEEGAAVRQARDDLTAAVAADWAAALDAIAGYDRSSAVATLTMPVVAIAAGLDAVSTPAAMQLLADRVPVARFVVRDEWAHMSPFVDPAGLAELLTRERDAALAG